MDDSPSTSSSHIDFQQLQNETEISSNDTNRPNDDDEDGRPFYFESDHLALKNNTDYQSVLRTVCLLEVQRSKAIQDLEKLYDKCDQALQDPIAFVQKLQNNEDLDLPNPQKVAVIPDVDWEKYTSSVNPGDFGLHKHLTRGKNKETDPDSLVRKTLPVLVSASDSIVRGRLKDPTKSSTFNKLWTTEEQKRLEELLLVYPPEPIEAHRFAKIAKALGNRTATQVASRIQKYFLKLAKAKLPIPGRVPRIAGKEMKTAIGISRYQKFYHPPSTFLQSYEPPVYMPDDDGEGSEETFQPAFSMSWSMNEDDVSQSDKGDDESLSEDIRQTQEYLEIVQLKKIKQEKIQGLAQHTGYKCDLCDMEPIVGSRWHCLQCPEDNSVDFCDNCIGRPFETETHNASHRLEEMKGNTAHQVMDSDYMRFMPGGYNYLDPNYMPAS